MPVLNTVSSTFVYDGDGKRVAQTINGVTTYFVGSHYEVSNGVVTKYYFAGGQRIALRKGGTLSYLLADHLGSTSLITNAAGAVISETRYKPWGETRYTWTNAPATTPAYELTKYQYTGQYSYDAEFGLYFYNARWYNPALGRFTQPDTLIPEQTQGTQAWDRYAYVNNNPLRYNDPSGHCPWCIAVGVGALVGAAVGYGIQVYNNYQNGLSGAAAWTQNISAEPIVNGAFIGAGAVIGAFVVTQAAVTLLPAATTATTLACADGDCTNEVTAAATAANNVVNAACADGDCTNEMRTANTTWTAMGNNLAGGTFYGSNGPVTAEDVSEIASGLSNSGGPVSILTGAHGAPSGEMLQEWTFYLEDLPLRQLPNTQVYNVYLTPMKVVENLKGSIVCAWCWSQNSMYIQKMIPK